MTVATGFYNLAHGLQQFQNIQSKRGSHAISLDGHYMSEKYDGVRAISTGTGRLLTAKGDPINVPDWFIEQLPVGVALDGEIYLGYGLFNEVSGLVRSSRTSEEAWRNVKFMVFDLPVGPDSRPVKDLEYSDLTFEVRHEILAELIPRDQPNVQLVNHYLIESYEMFDTFYNRIVKAGGEGVIINLAGSRYEGGKRSGFKCKPLDDSEAVVVGYREGNGKNIGLVGSLYVLAIDGDGQVQPRKSYSIGTGLTAYQRQNARTLYPVGTVVTCCYNGLSKTGIPRFPRLKGIRADLTVELDPKLIPDGKWVVK